MELRAKLTGVAMRYEVMRLMQFLFSLSLIVLAFGVGVFAGWYRWGPRSTPRRPEPGQAERARIDHTQWNDPGARAASTGSARSTLFSPVGEAWPRQHAPVDGGPVVLLGADEIVDLRRGHPSVRGELVSGSPAPLTQVVDRLDAAQLDH